MRFIGGSARWIAPGRRNILPGQESVGYSTLAPGHDGLRGNFLPFPLYFPSLSDPFCLVQGELQGNRDGIAAVVEIPCEAVESDGRVDL